MHRWSRIASLSVGPRRIAVLVTLTEEVRLLVAEDPILTYFIRLVLCGLEEVRALSNFAGEEAFRRLATLLLLPYLFLEEHLFLDVDTGQLLLAQFVVWVIEPLDVLVLGVVRLHVALRKHN